MTFCIKLLGSLLVMIKACPYLVLDDRLCVWYGMEDMKGVFLRNMTIQSTPGTSSSFSLMLRFWLDSDFVSFLSYAGKLIGLASEYFSIFNRRRGKDTTLIDLEVHLWHLTR
jgi:hypothetical protein